MNAPTRGLIIMAEPIEKILSGRKRLELRKGSNRQSGPIALIEKGSGCVVGLAEIGECRSPMSWSQFAAASDDHGVEAIRVKAVFESGYIYGWPLKHVKRLVKRVPYQHRPGAVIWATLDAECVRALSA